jgi:aspartate kinase
MIRVFKFGGALLANARNIEHMAGLVDEFSCQPLVVVVSAIGKTTNALENLLKLAFKKDPALPGEYFKVKSFHLKLIRELGILKEEELMNEVEEVFRDLWDALDQDHEDFYFAYDQVVSFGEKLSGKIISYKLNDRELPVTEIQATELIITDGNYTNATVNWEWTSDNIRKKVRPILEDHRFVLTHGFTGSDANGNTTTLGREGSDFTAAIFANILEASEIIIWKDVPGLMNADPNIFEDAVKLDSISYHEAVELAFYGAKVLHPKTIQPLQKKSIPLQIRSFFKPFDKPTVISNDTSDDDKIPKIILKENQVLLSISSKDLDFIAEKHLHKIFRSFTNNKVHINIMQNSAVSFSVSFNHHEMKLNSIINDLKEEFYLKYNTGLTLLTLRHYHPGLLKKMTEGQKIYLEQKNRTTIQVLVESVKRAQ